MAGKKTENAAEKMTAEEKNQAMRDLIYLCSCAVNRMIPNTDRVKGMNMEALYKVARWHLLTAITAYALEAAGVRDHAFTLAKAKAIRKVGMMDSEMLILFERLEQAGIWYMPLKGTVLKDNYPEFGMRQMSDHDILFDAGHADEVRVIMEDMGYSTEAFGRGCHDSYHKEPVCNFEMHRMLFGTAHDERFQAYYEKVEDRLLRDDGREYGRHFSPEDFYVYFITHEYKHFSMSGTGLRSVLDTYVLLMDGKADKLDWGYIHGELEKLGIADFEEKNRSLAMHLFGDGELTAGDEEMLEYFLSSGTYGNITHRMENLMKRNGWGKMEYVLHRFFVPLSKKDKDYVAYANAYPVFYEHKILLPTLVIYRVVRAMGNGRLAKEVRSIQRAMAERKERGNGKEEGNCS